jgi:uncharacterized membrane protein
MGSSTEHSLSLHHSRGSERGPQGVNVNDTERWISVLGGGVLAIVGLERRGVGGLALALVGGALIQRGVTGRSYVYGALSLDTTHDRHRLLQRQHGPAAVLDASRARKVERAVTIDRPREELYRFWRDFTNLPRVMKHLESVTLVSATRSHWKARAPAGQSVEWDAEIHNEVPNELIAWRSVDDASVPNAGSVHFRDVRGGRSTEVKVVLEYEPPAGRLGAAMAKLLGEEPDAQVREDLRRFKQMMEAGEVATTDGQSSGQQTAADRERAIGRAARRIAPVVRPPTGRGYGDEVTT